MPAFLVPFTRRTLPGALTLLLTLLVAPTARSAAQTGGIEVGAMAPADLTLETLDGKPYGLGSVIGKRPVVIEFWATWCPLCRKLEPQLQDARKMYGDRVTFVGIGVPENQSAERQRMYITEKKLDGVFLFDRANAATKAFQVPHTSYLVVLDAAGKVVYTGVGADQNIDEAVKRAFAAH